MNIFNTKLQTQIQETKMDSTNYNIPISTKETLLPQEQPPPSKKPTLKKPKLLISLSLSILIAGSITLSFIYNKSPKPDSYLSGSSNYFCHLTPHPQLCRTSMSSVINTSALKSGPGPIFATSLIVAINQLNNTATSITKALSKNNPLFGPSLSKCRELVHDSLSRLNESLATLGDDSGVESLSYVARAKASGRSAHGCFLVLDEKYDGEDEEVGVEEVKEGVEKAKKLIINSMWLFRRRDSIFFYFYNPYYIDDNYEYGYSYNYYNYYFEYRILICLYSVMYLFVALLYFLFWRGH